MSRYFGRETWTRQLEPFGITIHCRNVLVNKVVAMQYGTGSYVHRVDRAILEWVPGAPKMHIRYVLVCGNMRDQERARPITNKSVKITCPKCRRGRT